MSDHTHTHNDDYQLGGRSGKGFMRGQSGNPAGRPKKPTLKETIERILQEELPGKGMTKLEAVAHIWINEAMVKRDPRALSALINRLYPTPRLRPVDAEYPKPQLAIKLIEFVTYRDGPGQDYYREFGPEEMEQVGARSNPYGTLDDYRGDYPEGHFETEDDDMPPPNDQVVSPKFPNADVSPHDERPPRGDASRPPFDDDTT